MVHRHPTDDWQLPAFGIYSVHGIVHNVHTPRDVSIVPMTCLDRTMGQCASPTNHSTKKVRSSMQQQFDVVITAGYQPDKVDPLAEATGAPRKALVPIAGKPMIWHVAQALRQAHQIRDMVVVGIGADEGIDLGTPVTFEPNHAGMLDNVYAGLNAVRQIHPDAEMVMISSADIPLLTPEVVDWFITTCQQTEHDVYYAIIEKSVMETAFPESKRSYVPFREGRFCGGDLFMVRLAVANQNEALVREAMDRRKSAFRQAQLLGFGTLLKFVFRRMTIPDAESVASRLFGARGRAVISPYATIGMDVDKPFQYDLVKQIMEQKVSA